MGSRPRSALRNRFEYSAFLFARAVAHALPPATLARLGSLAGRLYLIFGRSRRKVLRFNLGLALPDLDAGERRRLERGVARHFGRVLLDALRLQRLTPEELLEEVTIEGKEHLDQALEMGRGVFLLSAHIGSWEVAALIAGLLVPGGFAVVNRPLDNPLLEAELERLRGLYGNRSLGKRNVVRGMLQQLKAGGAVGILIDQRARSEADIYVPFFGRPSRTHPILGRLARRTEAPVVPIWGLWDGPARYIVRFDPPLLLEDVAEEERDEVALTARYVAVTEAVIRQRPEQWLWYHDRWRDRPDRQPEREVEG
jgi:KDO2-lipid IV(A) lauroyltransferase